MIRKVLQFPNPLLLQPSKNVEKIDKLIKDLATDMLETMRAENGGGIHAVQVGHNINLMIVWDIATDITYTMVNTQILEARGLQIGPEGCLSRPGKFVDVERPLYVTAKYTDLMENEKTIKLSGYGARALVHENLHNVGMDPVLVTELPYPWIR